jgi:SAM-dependent methyltransferase
MNVLRDFIRLTVPRSLRVFLFEHIEAVDRRLAAMSPKWRAGRKYREELAFWRNELSKLRQWYEGESALWSGIPAPTDNQKVKSGKSQALDIVLTLNTVNPDYLSRLSLAADHFARKRVLDIGSGPLAPSQQFKGAEHHVADPLLDRYIASGWPMADYGVTLTRCHAEHLAYPDGYFDVILSMNALDHVDDFEAAAAEIERLLKVGGDLYLELEYHEPRELEPQKLSDERVLAAFRRASLCKKSERLRKSGLPGREGDRLAVWHGIRNSP